MEFNQIELYNEMSQNFIEYAVAVNSDRAIPDATTGLKPVAKRILWGAWDGGRTSNKPHVKCAKVVGDVMGSWHPHGDSSIYGALVRLAQPWVMRYPLMDIHGNLGTQDGDGPAAMRYTECRLTKLVEDGMLNYLKKNAVEYMPNYDESQEEPVNLPSIFPNLLCNPNTGIGVAMACNWAPHNLGEVAQAIYDYMDGKEPMLPGPDFPTGGIIINKNDIPAIMKTGHGSVKIRGKYTIDKQNIIFTELPYGVGTEDLITEIGKVCDEEKKIEGVANVRNESNKKGLRLVIECVKGTDPGSIINKLFAYTNLQTSFSYNQVALIDKVPTEMNLLKCCQVYVKHNIECLVREATFDLNKAQERKEIVDGLLRALEDIDNIIALIKKSESAAAARVNLIAKYGFTENQAKAIVDMKLGKLAGLEKIELQNEAKELDELITSLIALLASTEQQEYMIRKRLMDFVAKHGDKRKTELAQIEVAKDEKEIELVAPEECVVFVSQSGDVKRIPATAFKLQKRNGKGVKSEDDAILSIISTNTIDTLMIFTDKGKMYRLLVDGVPVGTNASKGVRINTLVNMEPDEKVIAATSLYRKEKMPKYVVFNTKQGLFKKTLLEEYMSVKRSTGIQAIKLKEGDSIANVTFCDEEEFIIVTKQGMSIRFETASIAPIGRVTSGVKSIKLSDGDEVLAGLPIHKTTDQLAVFTKAGYGKKTALDEFPVQGRGGKGLKCSGDEIIGTGLVSDEDNILLVGVPNSICFSAKDIPDLGRVSMGNAMIKNSIVKKVVKL